MKYPDNEAHWVVLSAEFIAAMTTEPKAAQTAQKNTKPKGKK